MSRDDATGRFEQRWEDHDAWLRRGRERRAEIERRNREAIASFDGELARGPSAPENEKGKEDDGTGNGT